VGTRGVADRRAVARLPATAAVATFLAVVRQHDLIAIQLPTAAARQAPRRRSTPRGRDLGA
jgi:hypothetical protein